MAETILTIKEVATYLKVAEKSIYRLLAQGKFPGFKVGGTWRFRENEIEHWISTQSVGMLDDKVNKDGKS
jgi:excisionase family DNA binding protein